MLVKLQSLYLVLKKIGQQTEASLLNLLIKIAGYDDEWKELIEESDSGNPKPFNNWFNGQKRIYFDFKPTGGMQPDEDVSNLLKDFGYEIIDYVGGYCQKDGRKFKIGKVLQMLFKQDIEEEKKKPDVLPERIQSLERYWKDIINEFNNSAVRKNKKNQNNLKIVFSQDPHDIAKMSYERSWTSCMNLGEGSNYKHLFCEVKEGGFVAYLITADDMDIEEPLARIHIRRFVNENGISIAKPEQNVYGNEVPGFMEFVKNWVEKNNQSTTKDVIIPETGSFYRRKGGEWSDSFSDVIPVFPKTLDGLREWIKGNVPDTKTEKWEITDHFYDELLYKGYWDNYGYYFSPDYEGSKVFDTYEEAERFKEYLIADNDWINYLDPDDFSYEETEDDDLNNINEQKILELNEKRFSISKLRGDSKRDLVFAAINELIDNYSSYVTSTDVELIENNEFIRLDSFNNVELLFKVYSKFPQNINQDNFAKFSKPLRKKLLEFFDENEEVFNKLKDYAFNIAEKNMTAPDVIEKKIQQISSYDYYRPNFAESPLTVLGGPLYDLSYASTKLLNDPKIENLMSNYLFKDSKLILSGLRDTRREKNIFVKFLHDFNEIEYFYKLSDKFKKNYAKILYSYVDIGFWEYVSLRDGNITLSEWLDILYTINPKDLSEFLPTLNEIYEKVEEERRNFNHDWVSHLPRESREVILQNEVSKIKEKINELKELSSKSN